MAKAKYDVDAPAKDSIARNAIFKKVSKEALRLESRHSRVKDVTDKTSKVSRSNKRHKHKHKHVAKAVPKHTLAAEFAACIKQSRETIENKAAAALNATYLTLSQRLVDSYGFLDQRKQDAINVNKAMTNPLNEQELEWTSTDGKQFGKTILGIRMKKFQKTIEAEEKELKRQCHEWSSVQAELRHLASLTVSPNGLDSLLAGHFDPESFVDAEQREMMEEIKAEQKAFMEQIEKAGQEAIETMAESEKKLELKQKKDTESFLAILRGDN